MLPGDTLVYLVNRVYTCMSRARVFTHVNQKEGAKDIETVVRVTTQ